MLEILIKNPILILFVIIALGYVIGRVRIGNFSLGVAGALFAGIAISAWEPKLALPPLVYTLGLVIFVYTTGLALGPTFFATLRKTGVRDNLFTLGVLIVGVVLAFAAAKYFSIEPGLATGMYTGTFTVTPALAGVLDAMNHSSATPVVGYSLAYPFSIIVSLILLALFRKIWKVDQQEDASEDTALNSHTVRYTREEPCAVHDVGELSGATISVSRLSKKGKLRIAKSTDVIEKDSLVTIVGTQNQCQKAAKWMGEVAEDAKLELENTQLGFRRVFISNNDLAGLSIAKLQLDKKFNVIVTRLRRGDVDMVAHDNLVVEPGDRLRIVGARENIKKASAHLGDSYKHSSQMNIFTFTLGMCLGIGLGLIPIPLPGGHVFQLGAAGGTIVVALILGAMRRTGRLVWQIPYSTNLALRQLGVVIFLAGVGSQAGSSLIEALADPKSYILMALSVAIAIIVCVAMILVGHKLLKIPFSRLSGMLAAMNTQPATLAFANDQTKTDQANIGYASVYPMALVAKIILAQALLILLAL